MPLFPSNRNVSFEALHQAREDHSCSIHHEMVANLGYECRQHGRSSPKYVLSKNGNLRNVNLLMAL